MAEDVRRFYEVRKQDGRCLQAVEVRTERERASEDWWWKEGAGPSACGTAGQTREDGLGLASSIGVGRHAKQHTVACSICMSSMCAANACLQ